MSFMPWTRQHLQTAGVCLIASAVGCTLVLAARLWITHDSSARPPAPPPVDPPRAEEAARSPVADAPTESPGSNDSPAARLVADALRQTQKTRIYDPAYVRMAYPGGDVPIERGVCADVIVRACRAAGLDLQKEIHEDMARRFNEYPALWGLTRPDPNIDHRRVPNLRTYFRRHALTLPVTDRHDDYAPGDVVIWQLPANRLHIGLVIDRRSADGRRPLMVHNVGSGAKAEDVLAAWPITDHFRLAPR